VYGGARSGSRQNRRGRGSPSSRRGWVLQPERLEQRLELAAVVGRRVVLVEPPRSRFAAEDVADLLADAERQVAQLTDAPKGPR